MTSSFLSTSLLFCNIPHGGGASGVRNSCFEGVSNESSIALELRLSEIEDLAYVMDRDLRLFVEFFSKCTMELRLLPLGVSMSSLPWRWMDFAAEERRLEREELCALVPDFRFDTLVWSSSPPAFRTTFKSADNKFISGLFFLISLTWGEVYMKILHIPWQGCKNRSARRIQYAGVFPAIDMNCTCDEWLICVSATGCNYNNKIMRCAWLTNIRK